jgi:hypothetical protein
MMAGVCPKSENRGSPGFFTPLEQARERFVGLKSSAPDCQTPQLRRSSRLLAIGTSRIAWHLSRLHLSRHLSRPARPAPFPARAAPAPRLGRPLPRFAGEVASSPGSPARKRRFPGRTAERSPLP